MTHKACGFAAVLAFIFVSGQLKSNKIADDEINDKYAVAFRLPDIGLKLFNCRLLFRPPVKGQAVYWLQLLPKGALPGYFFVLLMQ